MRLSICLLNLMAAALVSAEQKTAGVFIQPILPSAAPAPTLLAEVSFDTADPSTAEIASFEAPEIPEGAELVRIGIYDVAASRWLSSTSVTAVDNFSKGYSPTIVVSVDAAGRFLGASCRGVRIDAGQTRDFGPQAVVVVSAAGKQPDLNKPVVLSPEGKKIVQEEKTFLQKYIPPCLPCPRLFCVLRALADRYQVLVATRDWGSVVDERWGRRRAEVIESDSSNGTTLNRVSSSWQCVCFPTRW